jgi:hypothetical protein
VSHACLLPQSHPPHRQKNKRKEKAIRFHTPPPVCRASLANSGRGKARKGGIDSRSARPRPRIFLAARLSRGGGRPCPPIRSGGNGGGPERRDLGRSPAGTRPRQWRRRAARTRYWHCCCCCSARQRSCSPTRKVRVLLVTY